jgi:fructokinase
MSNQPVIVGLGEILWDIFPTGKKFGGAPANFACSAAALGDGRVEVLMVSAVGTDPLGDSALAALGERAVQTSAVARVDRPTGSVLVQLDNEGVAKYEFAANIAWDAWQWSDELRKVAARTDAVCFGTLAQRSEESRQTVQRFVRETPKAALRIFDINLRPPFYSDEVIRESLQIANVLKLNDDELPVVANLCQAGGSVSEQLQTIQQSFDLNVIAVTRGSQGALLMCGEELDECPGVPTELVDTVGAGDAYTAAMTLGLLAGCDLSHVNAQACEAAAYVCSQPGATPAFPAGQFNLEI